MRLVDVVRGLGLEDVELPGQVEEVVVEVCVGHDLQHLVVRVLVNVLELVLLAAEHVRELLLEHVVLALKENLLQGESNANEYLANAVFWTGVHNTKLFDPQDRMQK